MPSFLLIKRVILLQLHRHIKQTMLEILDFEILSHDPLFVKSSLSFILVYFFGEYEILLNQTQSFRQSCITPIINSIILQLDHLFHAVYNFKFLKLTFLHVTYLLLYQIVRITFNLQICIYQ